MEKTEQLSKLKALQTDLLKVLPERFELHEAFDVDQDLHIVLWDANEERQFILRPDTNCYKVINQLLECQREVGRIEGREEVRGPIKAALGL